MVVYRVRATLLASVLLENYLGIQGVVGYFRPRKKKVDEIAGEIWEQKTQTQLIYCPPKSQQAQLHI